MATTDRRELLAAAWDEEEKKEEVEETPAGDEPIVNEEIPAGEETPTGEEAPTGEEKPVKDEKLGKDGKLKKEETVEEKEARAAKDADKRVDTLVKSDSDKAPLSWKPAVREHWAKLPPEVRAEVNRRELEIQREMTQTGQIRKFTQDFTATVAPHMDLIRAQNSTPLNAVRNLMNTAAWLSRGSAEQKARVISEIIHNYGVDLKTLDDILSKGPMPGPGNERHAANQAPPAWARPMFEFMNQAQTAKQNHEQKLQEDAQTVIQSMEDKPFFDDLREDIADLMELSATRGRKMTIEQAYKKAVELDPEISRIVKQRNAANGKGDVSRAASTLARARKAASTVSGAPSGRAVGKKDAPKSRREALEAAWDDNEA